MEAYEQFQHDMDELTKETFNTAINMLKTLTKDVEYLNDYMKKHGVDERLKEAWDDLKMAFEHAFDRQEPQIDNPEKEIDFDEFDEIEEEQLEEALDEFAEDIDIDELENEFAPVPDEPEVIIDEQQFDFDEIGEDIEEVIEDVGREFGE